MIKMLGTKKNQQKLYKNFRPLKIQKIFDFTIELQLHSKRTV